MHPEIFLFNPTNEMAIANGQGSYMPPLRLQRFENDLAAIPWLLTNEQDFILISQKQGNTLEHLSQFGWKMPSLVTSPSEIPENMRINFSPWGWSPAVYNKLKPFYHLASRQWMEHPFATWKNNSAHLLSRETGYQLLNEIKKIKNQHPKHYDLIEIPYSPIKISNIKQLAQTLSDIQPPALIKTPWSASGRGLFRIRDHRDDPSQSDWIRGMLKRQKVIYLEKMLSKIQDVSFQFIINKNINYKGHNFFYTDDSGQFAGCAVGYPENSFSCFQDMNKVKEALSQGAEIISLALKQLRIEIQYCGPAGIDGLFFIDDQNEMKLQPCLEINLRYNMGLANLRLQNRIAPQAHGRWTTGIFKQEAWTSFCKRMSMENPPVFEQNKIKKGFLPLVNPYSEKLFGAWLNLK
ncbi:hypothetical protein ACT29H_15505 [Thermophagus sp. OGC60D27]|uniref:hypothetical protein n=1 Tax=Thermophagus sp. OGC60D27 TaxID=3458415 RepID=UPI004037A7C3